MINIFEPRRMLRVLEELKPVRTFLLDLFFRGETNRFDTRQVDIDIFKGKRTLAPFVSPRREGRAVERIGYTTKTYAPPYIKVFTETTAEDTLRRQPGEAVYSSDPAASNPQLRAARILGRDLAYLEEQITRREEWMAAEAVSTGMLHVRGEGVDDVIDFQMAPTHLVTLVGPAAWSDRDNSDPLRDLRKWRRRIIQDSGINPTAMILGQDALDAFLDHPKVLGKLDNRRVEFGRIDPVSLADGATYYGYIKDVNLDIYSYDEWYADEATGTEKPMVRPDRCILGSARARTSRNYAVIQDLDAIGSGQFAVPRYPKSWVEKNPSVRRLMLQSAALVVPHQIDAFMSIKVV